MACSSTIIVIPLLPTSRRRIGVSRRPTLADCPEFPKFHSGQHHQHQHVLCSRRSCGGLMNHRRLKASTIPAAIDQVSAAAGSEASADLTWQIIAGAIAGVLPFVVAGIEFSKRIMAQRRCEVCGGSGLVLRKKYYKRCPNCGGFLPWQSWKRFFSG